MNLIACASTAAVMVCGLLTGCQTDHATEGSISGWSGVVSDVRAQWDATSDIDLLTGAAVPLRAYLESRLIAQYTGDIDNAYTGFTQAVPVDEPSGPDISAWARRPPVDTPATSPLVGNTRFLVQSIRSAGDAVVATVCNYIYGLAKAQGDSYTSLVGWSPDPGRGVVTMRVTLTNTDQSPPALPPQMGPAAAPSEDVFSGWQIVGFLTASTGAVERDWPTFAEDRDRCVANAPDPLQRRANLLKGEHPRADFPTLPPEPGWPGAPAD